VPGPRLWVPGQRPQKVAIGTPCGGGNAGVPGFQQSLEALMIHEGTKPGGGLLGGHIPAAGLYIDHNRNLIVERFLEQTECQWLLQIDSDIAFPPTLLEDLLRVAGHDKKVLGASVPLGPPFKSSAWVMTNMLGKWACLDPDLISPEGTECHGLATAVVLIHREVFEAIAALEGQCWFLKERVPRLDDKKSRAAWENPEGPMRDRKFTFQGEDLPFCIRAINAGVKVWCARIPGLLHFKTVALSHDFDTDLPAAIKIDQSRSGSFAEARPTMEEAAR